MELHLCSETSVFLAEHYFGCVVPEIRSKAVPQQRRRRAILTVSQFTQNPMTELTVIFLDIDGVLLPFGNNNEKKEQSCSGLFPDRTLEALSKLFVVPHDSPNKIALVLSSTWRVRPEFCRDILQAFQDYNETFGNGSANLLPTEFYDITNVENHSERQWEIQDWLMTQQQQNNNNNDDTVTAWVALDDEELLEEDKNENYRSIFEGHVVKTTSSVGLTMTNVEMAIRLLLKQQQTTTTTTTEGTTEIMKIINESTPLDTPLD